MQNYGDGYLRLATTSLRQLDIQHLFSGLDEADCSNHVAGCGTQMCISGYTEWECSFHPGLSIGWDWSFASGVDSATCNRRGLPYSNLMLIDQRMHDLGEEATLRMLAAAIDASPWREITRDAVLEKYGT